MKDLEVIVPDQYTGSRIDKVLSEVTNLSRSQIQKAIKTGNLIIDGLQITKTNIKLKAGQTVVVRLQEQTISDIIPEDIPLNIIYEDEYVVVIDKEAGMVCHPAPGHYNGTIANAAMFHFKNLSDNNGMLRPGIVHRLDKDTSGLMILAKTNEAHDAFAKLFSEEKGKKIKRKYICYVFGQPERKSGIIENFITRHPRNRQMYTTSETHGKHAITKYHVISTKYFTATKAISKIECELMTGRTHQIRVHMKYMGHNIIGDQIYGKTKVENTYPEIIQNFRRQALHSYELYFLHPFFKKEMFFQSSIPTDISMIDKFF